MFRLVKTLLFTVLLGWSIAGFAASNELSININTASAEEIAAAVKGIGLKKAKRIVAYRESHGAFGNVSELAKVKGIGVKTIEKNLAVLRLEPLTAL